MLISHGWKSTSVKDSNDDGWIPFSCFGFREMLDIEEYCVLTHCHGEHVNGTSHSHLSCGFMHISNLCIKLLVFFALEVVDSLVHT